MRNSYPALDKYWVKQRGYFILATTLELGMGTTYGNPFFCNVISDQSNYNIISMKKNYKTLYECFNNHCSVYFGDPTLKTPLTIIDDSPCPNKRSRYTFDPLRSSISVTSVKSASMFTTPYYPQQLIELNFDNTDTLHTIISDNPCRDRIIIGYYSRFHDVKNMLQNEVILLRAFN